MGQMVPCLLGQSPPFDLLSDTGAGNRLVGDKYRLFAQCLRILVFIRPYNVQTAEMAIAFRLEIAFEAQPLWSRQAN
jgi:hypothetical protein